MKDRSLLRVGVAGSIVAAVCCATPVLALTLAALGLSAWLAYADYVLVPLLVAFLTLAGVAAYRLRGCRSLPSRQVKQGLP